MLSQQHHLEQSHPLAQGLIGLWLPGLDTRPGNLLRDISGSHAHAQRYDTIAWSSRAFASGWQSLRCTNGSFEARDGIKLGDMLSVPWTFGGFFAIDTISGTQCPVCVGSESPRASNHIMLRNGQLRWEQGIGEIVANSGLTPTADRWYMGSMSANNTGSDALYIQSDREYVKASRTGALESITDHRVLAGRYFSDGYFNPLTGYVGAMFLYNRVLSDAEHQALYTELRTGARRLVPRFRATTYSFASTPSADEREAAVSLIHGSQVLSAAAEFDEPPPREAAVSLIHGSQILSASGEFSEAEEREAGVSLEHGSHTLSASIEVDAPDPREAAVSLVHGSHVLNASATMEDVAQAAVSLIHGSQVLSSSAEWLVPEREAAVDLQHGSQVLSAIAALDVVEITAGVELIHGNHLLSTTVTIVEPVPPPQPTPGAVYEDSWMVLYQMMMGGDELIGNPIRFRGQSVTQQIQFDSIVVAKAKQRGGIQ